MDPNIQVAFISVLATLITTIGVIVVAVINNRKERGGAASAGVDKALDEKDVLGRMLSLITENERKESEIQALKDDNKRLRAENTFLRLEKSGEEESP